MSQFVYTPVPFMQAWRDYQEISASARAAYLANVTRAYREYLESPYPDRAAYETAERNYWLTYYHTCRQAWRRLENTMPAAPTPPAPVPEHRASETISGPYQTTHPYDHTDTSSGHWPPRTVADTDSGGLVAQPTYTHNQESDH